MEFGKVKQILSYKLTKAIVVYNSVEKPGVVHVFSCVKTTNTDVVNVNSSGSIETLH